jgi:hypothetical protein
MSSAPDDVVVVVGFFVGPGVWWPVGEFIIGIGDVGGVANCGVVPALAFRLIAGGFGSSGTTLI